MAMIDMEELIPQDHLVRKIREQIYFDFIYEEAEPYYSKTGRPSINPVYLMNMLLIGYIYGVRSERRLVERIRVVEKSRQNYYNVRKERARRAVQPRLGAGNCSTY
jgi:transposase